jgi:hypothetical protein
MARSLTIDDWLANCAFEDSTPVSRPARLATGATLRIEEIGSLFSHGVRLRHPRPLPQSPPKRSVAVSTSTTRASTEPTISTDMANVSLVVPSIHPLLMIETNGAVNHQPEFTAACITPEAPIGPCSPARSPSRTPRSAWRTTRNCARD